MNSESRCTQGGGAKYKNIRDASISNVCNIKEKKKFLLRCQIYNLSKQKFQISI